MMQENCFGFKVTPDSACPLLPQWRSSLPRRCPGCPSWSRQASRSSRTCSTEGCPVFSAPLEDSARCRRPARARCGELPLTRRCRRSPAVECQSEEDLLKVYSTKQQHFDTGEISSDLDRSSLCDIEKSSFKCFEIGLKMILPTQVHTQRITKTLLVHLPDLWWTSTDSLNFQVCHTVTLDKKWYEKILKSGKFVHKCINYRAGTLKCPITMSQFM